MTLLDYVKKLFTKGPELWEDTRTVHDPNTKATIKRDTARLRKCSLGIVSCDTPEEFYRICRRECPVGTVINPFEDDRDQWTELYEDIRILVRADLTRSLLMERNYKSSKTLLDVLERRDREHWAKETAKKTTEVSVKGATEDSTEPRELKITIVDA